MRWSSKPLHDRQREEWEAVRDHLPEALPPAWDGPLFDARPSTGVGVICGNPVWMCGQLYVLAGAEMQRDGVVWLHVSVSRNDKKLPSWANLAAVRRAFFAPTACVVQILPPESEHFTLAEVLHLWERRTAERLVPDMRRYDPILRAAGV